MDSPGIETIIVVFILTAIGLGILIFVLMRISIRMETERDKQERFATTVTTAARNPQDAIDRMNEEEEEEEAEGDQEEECTSELMEAAVTGNVNAVERLLKEGANVDETSGPYQQTALMGAASNGRCEVIETLFKYGAHPHIKDKLGLSVSFYACNNQIEALQLLFEHGADKWERETQTGQTLLFYAAARGFLDIAQFLIDQGLDLKIRVLDGATPLIQAVQIYYEHPDYFSKSTSLAEALIFLLAKGQRKDETDYSGKSAKDYALQLNADQEILQILS